jgi:single-stranded-DNA-specific exonuclease
LKKENYKAFKAAFEAEVQKTIPPELLIPEISIDAQINFSEINPKLIRILNQFEPFGPQNMTPVFMTKNVVDTGYGKTLGLEDEHLKLFVKQDNSEGIGVIGFGFGNQLELTKNRKPIEICYCIDENEFNGNVSLQLRLKDIKQYN